MSAARRLLALPIALIPAVLGTVLAWPTSIAAAPSVVATIPPLHGLTASVTEGVSTPLLLLDGGGSPHGFSLKPSQARRVLAADLIIWVGPELETSLSKLLKNIGSERLLTVSALEQVAILPGKRAALDDEHDHGHGHGHGHGGKSVHTIDPHLWLSPGNAKTIVRALAAKLSGLDPVNSDRYQANAERTVSRIDRLDQTLERKLMPVRDRPYVVFHDAYRYFEQRYGLNHAGALAIDPQRAPGARRVAMLRKRIKGLGARCVFAEPQFEPRLIDVLAEDTGARVATLDPLGSAIHPGPDAWFTLMRDLGDSLEACLSR